MSNYHFAQGAHYPTPRTIFPRRYDNIRLMRGTAQLLPSCWYPRAQYGNFINKLVGFSDSWFTINSNSSRIGWKPHDVEGQFMLYAYNHINGTWVHPPAINDDRLGIVGTEPFTWQIDAISVPGTTIFSIPQGLAAPHSPRSVEMDYHYCNQVCSIDLLPYFGGKPTAPWEMNLSLEITERRNGHNQLL